MAENPEHIGRSAEDRFLLGKREAQFQRNELYTRPEE